MTALVLLLLSYPPAFDAELAGPPAPPWLDLRPFEGPSLPPPEPPALPPGAEPRPGTLGALLVRGADGSSRVYRGRAQLEHGEPLQRLMDTVPAAALRYRAARNALAASTVLAVGVPVLLLLATVVLPVTLEFAPWPGRDAAGYASIGLLVGSAGLGLAALALGGVWERGLGDALQAYNQDVLRQAQAR